MTRIPDAISRREIVYGEPKRPVDYLALGQAYHEAGRPTDALDCALRIKDDPAGHDALVTAVRDAALTRGDFFVLNRVNGVRELDDAQWTRRAYDGVVAYAETKRAQVVLAGLWAQELRPYGVAKVARKPSLTGAMPPSWVSTRPAQLPDGSAKSSVRWLK